MLPLEHRESRNGWVRNLPSILTDLIYEGKTGDVERIIRRWVSTGWKRVLTTVPAI